MQIKTYACYHKNDEIRRSSSSGAVFSALASYVFSQKGVVYGVAMTEDCYSAEYIAATDENGLRKLRGSKYFQAKVGDAYKNVKKDLCAGRIVLFSGTGCQVNGLKKYLAADKTNCEKLICVDVVCHGVPSPALWRKYAIYQEKKYSGKLRGVEFRCKDASWADFGMKEVLSSIPADETEKIYISKKEDPFMQMFLRNYCLRPSCYECVVKKNKLSDITIGDFWGIDKAAPQMNDGQGTSLVILRTEKGADIFERIEDCLAVQEVTYGDGVKGNPSEYRSVAKPVQRDRFFPDMRDMDFDNLVKKYAAPIKMPLKTKVKRVIKRAGAVWRRE